MSKIVAEICLYGTSKIGHGFLVSHQVAGKIAVDGEVHPRADRSMSEAIWSGVDLLRTKGVRSGCARIFAPGGERCVEVEIGHGVSNAGSLEWRPI